MIVAREFPPSASVAAMRPLRLVRRIREFGWEPYVLTARPGCQRPVDVGLEQQIPPDVHVERVPCWSLWRHSKDWRHARPYWKAACMLTLRVAAVLSEWIVPIDIEYPWSIAARNAGAALVRQHGIDLIWSTQPPLTSLCLARSISRQTGVPYVVDYRDVTHAIQGEDRTHRRSRYDKTERDALLDAAGITYTAPVNLATLHRKHPAIADKPACLAHNCFDATEALANPRSRFSRPTVVHGGFLYRGKRALDGFLEALRVQASRSAVVHDALQFVQYGNRYGDVRYLERLGSDLIENETMTIEPMLPRGAFLSACRGADILLLVVGHTTGDQEHTGAIPGKLFDYFAAARPILVVGPPDCEAARWVTRLNRGIASPDNDPAAIAQAIDSLLQGRGAQGPLDLSMDTVREFEAAVAVKTMATFFSSLVDASAAAMKE